MEKRRKSGILEGMDTSSPSHWPTLWRGESSGVLFDEFSLSKTQAGSGFFFAEKQEDAAWYACPGTAARPFVVDPGKCLDLRDPYHAYIQNPAVCALIDDLKSEFDEWVDRSSGEPGHPNDWLESGTLYDYEGNGQGQRWHTLFRLAWAHGFDSVVVHDATDGVDGRVATTWVVRTPSQIYPAPEPSVAPPKTAAKAPGLR